jgi:hypothetical protein
LGGREVDTLFCVPVPPSKLHSGCEFSVVNTPPEAISIKTAVLVSRNEYAKGAIYGMFRMRSAFSIGRRLLVLYLLRVVGLRVRNSRNG